MRTIVFIALSIVISNIKAQDTIKKVVGPHGGSIKHVENYNLEILNAYNSVLTYLYDKGLSPISNKGINGDIMFIYADNASLNVKLKAIESNGFIAEITNQDYFYFVINLNISGKFISAKFDNFSRLAKKQKK